MALVQAVRLVHLPPEYPLYLSLYTEVQNTAFLRQQLLDGNRDFEYAFIDASMILSTTHLLAAAHRAINDLIHDRLRTTNVHSEIVFALGSTNNISTTLRAFGITPTTRNLFALKVGGPQHSSPGASGASGISRSTLAPSVDAVQQHLSAHVQGEALPVTDESIARFTHVAAVRKAYKLGQAGHTVSRSKGGVKGAVVNGDAGAASEEGISAEERADLTIAAVGLMALRGS